ncbi:MAG: Blue-light-activated protein [Myxococcaceae bacterium]|nr:Blue-light-activated protein [Myxococcaceae bacterium]
MSRLLVIDDDSVDRAKIRRLLGDRHTIVEAPTASEGLRALASGDVDCVLLDYRLPDDDGLGVLDRMGGDDPLRPVLVLTAYGSEQGAADAMRHGASDYISKDELSRGRLERAIDGAIAKWSLKAELVTAETKLVAQQRELVAANEALRDSQRRLRFILDELPVVHWTTDAGLRITHLGGAGLPRTRLKPAACVGRTVAAVLGATAGVEPFLHAHASALAGGHATFQTETGRHAYQSHVGPLAGADGQVVGTVGVALDVTDAHSLEQQLRHAVKMDALGRLAGGVAHDFNNLLSAILGFAEYARDSLPATEPAVADIEEVIRAGLRAADLVRQLLTFSRTRSTPAQVLDVGPLLVTTLPMLRRLVGEDVLVRHSCPADLWPCRVDPGALEQVVVNLVVNARDAMPRGGAIDVEVRNVTLDDELAHARGPRVGPGDYVLLSVSDEGGGMSPEVQGQVFDPFFTTKEVGKGTGLGLSTVYGIVRQAGGTITLYSELGRGTTFRVYLPRAGAVVERPHAARAATPLGDETILLVEDDAAVRSAALRALQRLGYTVLEAHDGDSALARCRSYPGSIDLVLCDVVMPGRPSPEVVDELQRERPGVRVLYMSGYTERAARERGGLPAGAVVVEKPLSPDRLGRAVREAFARR